MMRSKFIEVKCFGQKTKFTLQIEKVLGSRVLELQETDKHIH